MEETEITVQVFNTFDEIDKTLKSQGFKITDTYELNDWYFTKFDDISNISYPNLVKNSFLLRQILSNNNEKVKLCFKNKIFDENNNVLSEEKTETSILNLKNTLEIFKKASLNNYCTVKNTSYIYKKNNIHFALQIIENLGIFIEYEENETMSNLTPNEKIKYLINDLQNLNLNLGDDYFCKKVLMILNKKN